MAITVSTTLRFERVDPKSAPDTRPVLKLRHSDASAKADGDGPTPLATLTVLFAQR